MAKLLTVFDVFLSCPSDMRPERAAVEEAIDETNAVLASRDAFFRTQHWERDALPMLTDQPQNAINTQLLDKADIICAIIGLRVGSPTRDYQSGTIEEITRFIESKGSFLNGRSVQIYFKSEMVDPMRIDLDQLAAVKNLKDSLSKQGVFYKEFSEIDELQSLVRRAMMECVNLSEQQPEHLTPTLAAPHTTLQPSGEDEIDNDGFFDYLAKFQTNMVLSIKNQE